MTGIAGVLNAPDVIRTGSYDLWDGLELACWHPEHLYIVDLIVLPQVVY